MLCIDLFLCINIFSLLINGSRHLHLIFVCQYILEIILIRTYRAALSFLLAALYSSVWIKYPPHGYPQWRQSSEAL